VRESLEVPRWIGAVHRRHRTEQPFVPAGEPRERSQRELAPLVVRRIAELGQIGLRDQHVELAGLR
jgi:hypothetical protein